MPDEASKSSYTRTPQEVKAAFEAAKHRFDLVPEEVQNNGQSLDHHERCTLATIGRPFVRLEGVPLSRPTIKPAPKP